MLSAASTCAPQLSYYIGWKFSKSRFNVRTTRRKYSKSTQRAHHGSTELHTSKYSKSRFNVRTTALLLVLQSAGQIPTTWPFLVVLALSPASTCAPRLSCWYCRVLGSKIFKVPLQRAHQSPLSYIGRKFSKSHFNVRTTAQLLVLQGATTWMAHGSASMLNTLLALTLYRAWNRWNRWNRWITWNRSKLLLQINLGKNSGKIDFSIKQRKFSTS